MAGFLTDGALPPTMPGSLSAFDTPGVYGSMIVREPIGPKLGLSDLDPALMWRTQPSLRKVIDYAARQIASTPCKAYRRTGDNSRERLPQSHQLTRTLAEPSKRKTPYRFWHSVVTDWLLWDRWAALVTENTKDPGRAWDMNRVQAARFGFLSNQWGDVVGLRVGAYGLTQQRDIDVQAAMYDNGYAALSAAGTSPVETLAVILRDNATAAEWRQQVRTGGVRATGVIERPAEAPDWHQKGKDGVSGFERFAESWSSFQAGGGREGGTPILEGGMKYVTPDLFSPRDVQDIQGRQLNDIEVCSAYHIAPELVGARAGNYSNVDAFRQDLYRTSLGPLYVALEQVANLMLVPNFDDPDVYVEFDLDAKLRGSFEEQANVLSTSTGRPWMTTNEARGRVNLPGLGSDGDQLVTPLNVITGGLASPTDTAPNGGKAAIVLPIEVAQRALAEHAKALEAYRITPAVKAAGDSTGYEDLLAVFVKALEAHFGTMADQVLQGLENGGRLDDLRSATDWDALLANVIGDHSYDLALAGAEPVLTEHNPEKQGWSAEVMKPWLAKAALSHAKVINRGLFNILDQAAEDDRPAMFQAQQANSVNVATSIGTESKSFGAHDAAEASGLSTKTWNTGSNPRDRHKKMDGETVAITDSFSNGARYPGDFHLSAKDRVNCNCDVVFSDDNSED